MSKNWAIVVGINNYDNLQPLKYAKEDAEVMTAWFREEAKFDQVFLFTEDSPTILTNPPIPTQPSHGRFKRFLNAQFEQPLLKPEDNLWFFFAGHGKRYVDQDYLMFLDSDPTDHTTAISIDYVMQRLRRSGADNVILLIDACRNEGNRSGLGVGIQNYQGVITFYSCTANQISWEIDELQQGAFTYALLEALQISGEGNCATVERLDQYLRYRVPAICRQYNKYPEQNPRTSADPATKLHFILMPKYATFADVSTLKNDAYRSEVDGNWQFAEQIWMRLLAISFGRDMEVINAIQRIAQLKIVPSSNGNNSIVTPQPILFSRSVNSEKPEQLEETTSSAIFSEQFSRSGEIIPKLVESKVQDLHSVSQSLIEETENLYQNRKKLNYLSGNSTSKLWYVFVVVGASVIAVASGLGWWWQNRLISAVVVRYIYPIPSLSLAAETQPAIDLRQIPTGMVATTAEKKLYQGDLEGGLAAVEELLNRNALATAQAALNLVPSDQNKQASVNFLKGRLAWQSITTGDKKYSIDDARRYWKAAVIANPNSFSYTNALGFAYYAEGNINQANDTWFKALNLALKQRSTTATAEIPLEALPTYAGLALGIYKSARDLPSDKQAQYMQYMNEVLKLRQTVLEKDPVNYQPDKLSKNWLWTETILKDWRSVLQYKRTK